MDFFQIFLFATVYVVFWVVMPTILEPRSLTGERIPEELIDTTVIRQREPADDNWVMNYFVAGLFNQPKSAYSFFAEHNYKDRSDKDGVRHYLATSGPDRAKWFEGEGITYVPYHFDGDDFSIMAECIKKDILENGYEEARIFGISVGCKVTKYFNNMAKSPDCGLDEVSISCYEINPCWTPRFLKPELRGKLRTASTFLTVVDHLVLGWLGFVPVIRKSGNWFSIRLADAMLKYIAFDQKDGYLSTRMQNKNEARVNFAAGLTRAVIVSKNDEFLDSEAIRKYYRGATEIYEVDTSHANTIDGAIEYYRAFQKIIEKER